jgi:hypothetical protein
MRCWQLLKGRPANFCMICTVEGRCMSGTHSSLVPGCFGLKGQQDWGWQLGNIGPSAQRPLTCSVSVTHLWPLEPLPFKSQKGLVLVEPSQR